MNGEPTLAEIGRAITRIEHNVEELQKAFNEEVRAVRHRVNNVDTKTAAYDIRFETVQLELSELKESQRWAFRMIASAMVGLIAEGAFIVLTRGA